MTIPSIQLAYSNVSHGNRDRKTLFELFHETFDVFRLSAEKFENAISWLGHLRNFVAGNDFRFIGQLKNGGQAHSLFRIELEFLLK